MTMWRWLTRKRRVAVNVAVALDKPHPYAARDRVLSDSEVRWLWQACDEVGPLFGPLTKLLLLLGQRRDEVGGMLWSELSPDLATWTLPGSRVKNGKSHVVPLPPLAQELIGSMPRIAGSDFVFTGRTAKTAVSGFSRIKQRLDELMLAASREEAIERGDDLKAIQLAPWRFHDLRRTCATGMAELWRCPAHHRVGLESRQRRAGVGRGRLQQGASPAGAACGPGAVGEARRGAGRGW